MIEKKPSELFLQNYASLKYRPFFTVIGSGIHSSLHINRSVQDYCGTVLATPRDYISYPFVNNFIPSFYLKLGIEIHRGYILSHKTSNCTRQAFKRTSRSERGQIGFLRSTDLLRPISTNSITLLKRRTL